MKCNSKYGGNKCFLSLCACGCTCTFFCSQVLNPWAWETHPWSGRTQALEREDRGSRGERNSENLGNAEEKKKIKNP